MFQNATLNKASLSLSLSFIVWTFAKKMPTLNFKTSSIMKFLKGSWIFSSKLKHKLIINSELPSSLWMQPWPYPDATCSCPSSPPYPTSDKPTYIQLLLEDLLVGKSRNIMQFQALRILTYLPFWRRNELTTHYELTILDTMLSY